MTLGSKLRTARTDAGLTQEELATKLCVSRQAITKWESDKGMPDIANLRAIAELFGVSVDYLVADDSEVVSGVVGRQRTDSIVPGGAAGGKFNHDAVVQAAYPKATLIQQVVRGKKLSRWEGLIDFVVAPGTMELGDALTHRDIYYLVELGSHQLLVKVDKEYVESQELTAPFAGRKLVIGSHVYTKVRRPLVSAG